MTEQQAFDDTLFAGLDEAKDMGTGGGSYPVAGHYLLLIDVMKAKSGHKGRSIINQMTVIYDYEDGDHPVSEDWTEHPERRSRPGTEVSHVMKPRPDDATRHAYFLADLKNFVARTAGIPFEEATEARCAKAYKERVFEGMVVEMRNRNKAIQGGTHKDKPMCVKSYVRAVPASEYAGLLSEDVIKSVFGKGDLEAGKAELARRVADED